MPFSHYISRMVNLEPMDYHIAQRLAAEKGYGKKGLSAAIRFILRDWEAKKKAASPQPPPSPKQR